MCMTREWDIRSPFCDKHHNKHHSSQFYIWINLQFCEFCATWTSRPRQFTTHWIRRIRALQMRHLQRLDTAKRGKVLRSKPKSRYVGISLISSAQSKMERRKSYGAGTLVVESWEDQMGWHGKKLESDIQAAGSWKQQKTKDWRHDAKTHMGRSLRMMIGRRFKRLRLPDYSTSRQAQTVFRKVHPDLSQYLDLQLQAIRDLPRPTSKIVPSKTLPGSL